jgi:hypothetical protein
MDAGKLEIKMFPTPQELEKRIKALQKQLERLEARVEYLEAENRHRKNKSPR